MPAVIRRRSWWLGLAVIVVVAPVVLAQQATQAPQADPLLTGLRGISSHMILDWVKTLSSEQYGGRLTGTPEYDACAEWSSGLFTQWGAKPAGDGGTYLQRFANPYTLVKPGTELSMRIPLPGGGVITKAYRWEDEFYQGATSDSGTLTADTVYVGYGITAPELGYDDYAGIDVRGKIVVMEPEVPMGPDPDPTRFARWRPYSFHDYKIKNAVEHGAAGLIYDYFIVNPNALFVKGFVTSVVGKVVMDDLFAGQRQTHGQTVEQIRRTLKPASQVLGKTVTIRNTVEHHPEGVAANVVAIVPGADPVLAKETIIIGAHLDHLGRSHELMPGAHDNASGVAVLFGVARAIHESGIRPKRTLLYILFGAEEQGVKGSEYYIAHPVVPHASVKAFINLESVGRGERIVVGSGKNHPGVFAALERANEQYTHRQVVATANTNLARPRQDAAHFLWAGIPTVSIGVSGAAPLPYTTYHTTRDRWELLTPETMEDLARMVYAATVELAGR